MEEKVIVMFGGSFNPPLNSHFLLAQQIINTYPQIEKVVFVPVHQAYEKPNLLANSHRYEMLKLVCDKNTKFEVDTVELDNTRPLYTYETLSILEKTYPNYTIWFTLGSDNLQELVNWKHPELLVKHHKIIVLTRDQEQYQQIINSEPFLKENESCFLFIQNPIRTNMSSTLVRSMLKQGKDIRYLVPDDLYEYIQKYHLYKESDVKC